jgi:uncharacterized membrane protein YfcA
MEQALAQGTSLAMMVPILIVGWWRYTRRHPVALGTALPLAVLASAATYGVAQVATGLDSGLLRSLFGVFLVLIALRMLTGRRPAGNADGAGGLFDRRWQPLVGIPGGACMGLLGVGGGLLATPIFTQVFGQRQTVAQSLSLVLVTPCSAVALLTLRPRPPGGLVDWPAHGHRRPCSPCPPGCRWPTACPSAACAWPLPG